MITQTNDDGSRPLAVITGASAGIGRELARLCAAAGYDCVIAADGSDIEDAARELRAGGVDVETVRADLSTYAGNDRVLGAMRGRPVALLLANASHGLGHAFLDQPFHEIRHVIDTNVTGTLYLTHAIARRMRQTGRGRLLITGSIGGRVSGAFQAVYNGTKAMIDSFAKEPGSVPGS